VTSRPHANLDLIKRALGQNYLNLEVQQLTLVEDSASGKARVKVEVREDGGGAMAIEGEGVGLVDALFGGLVGRYGPEYQSLKSIELVNFAVSARVDTKQRKVGLDAVGEVVLEVRNSEGARFSFADSSRALANVEVAVMNSEGRRFVFSDESRSVTASAARALIAVVEYFVNAERAFITLWKSRQDARERGRDDLVTRYTEELSEVVKSTSYAEVIENIKKEL
jgi:hypothetical protein